ncbi:MAG: hypothetical protein U1F31_12505 [Steroidobacteraceae bacterium]
MTVSAAHFDGEIRCVHRAIAFDGAAASRQIADRHEDVKVGHENRTP